MSYPDPSRPPQPFISSPYYDGNTGDFRPRVPMNRDYLDSYSLEQQQHSFKRPRYFENYPPNSASHPLLAPPPPLNRGTSHIFYKTRMCMKFMKGNCKNDATCTFAHGPEDLRKPLPNWQAFVKGRGTGNYNDDPKIMNRPKICNNVYNGEEFLYGEKCIFLHERPANFQTDMAAEKATKTMYWKTNAHGESENKPSTKMPMLLSTWSNNVETVPANYILPPEKRPSKSVEVCKEIPVIDLGLALAGETSKDVLVQQIMKASQEYGIFQVINHGVSEDIIKEAKALYKELFQMSAEDKGLLCSDSYGSKCSLFTGSGIKRDGFELWKDTLRHSCYPLEQHISSWPEKPTQYREVVGRYAVEVRKLGLRILDLIGQGLGLEQGFFDGELTRHHDMAINYYPPCPDPTLAIGIGAHKDPPLIALLQQDVAGLQILKDGKWIGVEPLPNAFVVNGGCQLEIISNGKIKSAEHRGVTNSKVARTSIVTFLGPSLSTVVEPAKDIVAAGETPIFKASLYGEFRANYIANIPMKSQSYN